MINVLFTIESSTDLYSYLFQQKRLSNHCEFSINGLLVFDIEKQLQKPLQLLEIQHFATETFCS